MQISNFAIEYIRENIIFGETIKAVHNGPGRVFSAKKCRGYDSRDTVPKKSFLKKCVIL